MWTALRPAELIKTLLITINWFLLFLSSTKTSKPLLVSLMLSVSLLRIIFPPELWKSLLKEWINEWLSNIPVEGENIASL